MVPEHAPHLCALAPRSALLSLAQPPLMEMPAREAGNTHWAPSACRRTWGVAPAAAGTADCLQARAALAVCGHLSPAPQRRQAGNLWGLHAWSGPGRPGSSAVLVIDCARSGGQLGLHEGLQRAPKAPKGRCFLLRAAKRWREGGPVFSYQAIDRGAASNIFGGHREPNLGREARQQPPHCRSAADRLGKKCTPPPA